PGRSVELVDRSVAQQQSLRTGRTEVDHSHRLVPDPVDLGDGAEAEGLVGDLLSDLDGDDLSVGTDPIGETGRRCRGAGTRPRGCAGPAPNPREVPECPEE